MTVEPGQEAPSNGSATELTALLRGADPSEIRVVDVRRGGLGEVYISEIPPGTSMRVALKTFQQRLFFDPFSRRAFVREAVIWSRLAGIPFVMPVLGIRQIGERPFVVMPAAWAGRGSITSVRDQLTGGGLPATESFELSWRLALALADARDHRVPGLVHGDIKPDNVLLWAGTHQITDFGLAASFRWREHGAVPLGTWAYLAPECWTTEQRPGVAADIYAFGTMLYELLLGSTPFRADTANAWRDAHLAAAPPRPLIGLTGFAEELLELAFSCIRREPSARPGDFREISDALTSIGQRHYPEVVLELERQATGLTMGMAAARQFRVPMIAAGLLQLGEPDLALEEIDLMPPELMSGRLWTLRGSALSLTGNDEAALAAFNQAIEVETDPDERIGIATEAALSMKRLGNRREAANILERVLPDATDRMRSAVLVNLAGVLIEDGQPDRGRGLMQQLTQLDPDNAEAWAQLGFAHAASKEYSTAAAALQRAISLAPQHAEWQMALASICMDQLGWVERALITLDAAQRQGFASAELGIRMLACHLALKPEPRSWLRDQLERFVPTDDVEAAAKSTRQLARRARRAARTRQADTPQDLAPKGTYLWETVLSAERRQDSAVPPAEEDKPSPDAHDGGTLITGEHLPFFNFRLHADGTLSVDFYDDLKRSEYADAFVTGLSTHRRAPELADLLLRGNPFRFTQCDSCGFVVLTNRDEETLIRCRSCGTKSAVSTVIRPDLEVLRAEILQSLRPGSEDLGEYVMAVLLQPQQDRVAERVTEICLQEGFTPTDEHALVRWSLVSEALRRGSLSRERPLIIVSKPCRREWYGESGMTPPEVASLVQRVRLEAGPTISLSVVHEAHQKLTSIEDAVAALRQHVEEHPRDLAALITLGRTLMGLERFDDASQVASRVLELDPNSADAWVIVARADMVGGNLEEARVHLEEATRLNPLDRLALQLLDDCYRALGMGPESAEIEGRLYALGGRIDSLPPGALGNMTPGTRTE